MYRQQMANLRNENSKLNMRYDQAIKELTIHVSPKKVKKLQSVKKFELKTEKEKMKYWYDLFKQNEDQQLLARIRGVKPNEAEVENKLKKDRKDKMVSRFCNKIKA